MRIRLGLFKTPGSAETQQAIHTSSWVNVTIATNQLLLERFSNRGYSANASPHDGIMPIRGHPGSYDRDRMWIGIKDLKKP
jgi:hypothetical protein